MGMLHKVGPPPKFKFAEADQGRKRLKPKVNKGGAEEIRNSSSPQQLLSN